MAIGSLRDVYLDELSALYDSELQIVRTLPRLAESARDAELRSALVRHAAESRLHLERLDLIFTHWGEARGSQRSAGLTGIVQEADARLHDAATDEARDAAILGAARRIEHYEIAAYGTVRAHARRLNRPDEARLLQETLDDESRADRLFATIEDTAVSQPAALQT
jgi:ferritin-like metal-binding protein YciE